ncbi:MAG: SsrA-binding protein SmpB [Cytophagales bacterium]|nr:SsrA-binding protein SmpB [Cytophagales bacterium]
MSIEKEKIQKTIEIRNKKAGFEYHFIDTFTAGVVLTGTEIKSIRLQEANLQDAYCYLSSNEVYIKNLHIAPYENGTYLNHDPVRERKLLLTKTEIKKISKKLDEQGITLIPTKLFINQKGFAKIELATAKGKKLYDKREDIKVRDLQRETGRKY